MERACSWSEPPSNIASDAWALLSTLYDSPSDIDIFTAGLVEDLLPGANLGATFACIVGGQFKHLKWGDRFFFTHNPGDLPPTDPSTSNPNPFTQSQLDNLRNRHLGDIICDNTNIAATRINVFQTTSNLLSCHGPRNRLSIELFIESPGMPMKCSRICCHVIKKSARGW